MYSRTKLFLMAALVLSVAACREQGSNNRASDAPAPTPTTAQKTTPGPLAEADVASLRQLGASVSDALQRGDYAAAAALYTDDSVRYPPDGPAIKGRDAMQKDWQSLKVDTKEWKYTSDGMVGSGDIAFEKGHWSWTVTPTGKPNVNPNTVSGDCMTVFQKQRDGSWKIAAESFSVHQLAGASRNITELGRATR